MTVPFPGYSDSVDVMALRQAVESLINAKAAELQAALAATGLAGKRVEYGSVTVPISGTPPTGSVNVTFSQPFTGSLPAIVVSGGNWLFTVSWGDRTLTGFRVNARRSTEASTSVTNIPATWIAIGNE